MLKPAELMKTYVHSTNMEALKYSNSFNGRNPEASTTHQWSLLIKLLNNSDVAFSKKPKATYNVPLYYVYHSQWISFACNET